VLDTTEPLPNPGQEVHEAGSEIPVESRSVVVLVREG